MAFLVVIPKKRMIVDASKGAKRRTMMAEMMRGKNLNLFPMMGKSKMRNMRRIF